jgi:hypothetical protein
VERDKVSNGSSNDPLDVAVLQFDPKHPLIDALSVEHRVRNVQLIIA